MTGAQSALFAEQPVLEFKGEHRFLSNFYVHAPILPRGPWWSDEVEVASALGPGFPSVEHAFQAAKVEPATKRFVEHYRRIGLAGCESSERDGRGSPDPGLAKRLGSPAGFEQHGATFRRGWDQIKVPVMLACLRAKFAPTNVGVRSEPVREENLDRLLMATSPRVLVEGNTWGDTYWGVCGGRGKNMLGRLLMLVRAELLCAAAAGLRVEELR